MRFPKLLSKGISKNSGRNNSGKITCRHKGGGHSKKLRLLGLSKKAFGSYSIISFHYDPFRNVSLALVQHSESKLYSFVLNTSGIEVGNSFSFSSQSNVTYGELLPGTRCFVSSFPLGSFLHDVDCKYAKSAGSFCTLVQKSDKFCFIRLSSGVIKKVSSFVFASYGKVGNERFYLKNLFKAGQSRWIGKRPTVRGVAINPVDHPHGGGEGKSSGGRPSVSPWGWLTKK
uniref:Ribosomal protein L2 n=1 Tax=Aurantiochytrium acetophilum TaxID=2172886 RepID=A0A481XHR2_9STRA|nr:ribosomal protein L2 [Aurantiochytrium acetophilum]